MAALMLWMVVLVKLAALVLQLVVVKSSNLVLRWLSRVLRLAALVLELTSLLLRPVTLWQSCQISPPSNTNNPIVEVGSPVADLSRPLTL